jgi:dTDP-4-dehydrorhamnose reductase
MTMRLLVTGAGGMLGRDVLLAAAQRGHEVSALTHADLDIADNHAVRAAIDSARPEVVVNCAAYTNVDGAEDQEEAALEANGDGAGNLARAAHATGARMVHVSTDYVFDGTAERPYVESDPVAPRTAYGRTKLAGEREVVGASDGHAVVRTAWIFGVGGKNFVDTMLGLAAGRDEVKVVTDQVGSPTWSGHLAPALLDVAERGTGGVLHVAGGGSCSWNELATEAFRVAGLSCKVLPATTADMPRPAPRPPYSVLGTERHDAPRLPSWQEGVAGYMAARAAQPPAPAEPAPDKENST